ncbi:uncharacterized protein LOC130905657 isoform X6 [Corythoichthys intestinalis]|uniref:uncharacterized protein LOC130905657 isoform X6 n=1 Tax=Corythoichthys intestinalis TaxID=161448 RepID=UPI0025A5A047|nr:uncharacterized protein LOC130905657 isoform X6 [Corythoichthys intestinalis]
MSDANQAHRPELQESPRMEEKEEESPYVKVEEEFVLIKEERKEYLITVENPHIEEKQQSHPLKKEEEDPSYVKDEVVDVPEWTCEPLKGEDGGPSDASRGAKSPSGGSSSSTEGSQIDNLITQPSESDNATSHSLFYVSQVHRPELQESARIGEEDKKESPYIKVEEEFVHIKEEQEEYFIRVENPLIEEKQESQPLKKEEENPSYVKEEVVDVPKWTGEPLKGEDGGSSEARRGAEPPSGSGSSTEGSQADNLIAQPHSLFCVAVNRQVNTLPRAYLCRQEIPDVRAKLQEAEALTGA